MMHSPIDVPSSRWCILRTSGGKTLDLATSLCAAGLEAWTPRRITKQPKRGVKIRKGERRPMVEVASPILPTFVFARGHLLPELATLVGAESREHPAFSIFHFAGRVPLVSDRDVAGLQEEERRAIELLERLRECETREERRRERIALMQTERARRKALRTIRADFTPGQQVVVRESSSMAGMTGVIESSNGTAAKVSFGGGFAWTIEAWQLSPFDVNSAAIAA